LNPSLYRPAIPGRSCRRPTHKKIQRRELIQKAGTTWDKALPSLVSAVSFA
jgi:hypothetical protein